MKELSTEQKAKAYDEAIERARQIHDADRVSGIELTTCEEIFPELKESESEDEKTRKELLDYCKNKAEKYPNDPKYKNISAWIAWLEKQGEQKFSDIDNKFLKMRETKPANIVEFLDRLTTVEQEFLLEHIEKVKKIYREEREQKPVIEMKSAEESLGIDSDTYNKIVDECIYDYEKDRADAIAEIQKPWSEEDEKILNEVILDLKVLKHRDSGEEGKASYQKEIDWLESIKFKNKWKPSDEQLNNILDVLSFDNCTPNRRKLLESLYTDLKKLRGE